MKCQPRISIFLIILTNRFLVFASAYEYSAELCAMTKRFTIASSLAATNAARLPKIINIKIEQGRMQLL